MSWNTAAANSVGLLLFNGTTYDGFAENDTTGPLTNLYIALHTADPGAAGTGSTSEISYTGYARVAVARTSGGFTVTNNVVTNTAAVTFGACTAGSGTATYFSITVASSGTSQILARGQLNGGGLAISAGITPSFAIGALSATFTN
jgi:hypothetical protein